MTAANKLAMEIADSPELKIISPDKRESMVRTDSRAVPYNN